MREPESYSHQRYLRAKQTVTDRCLSWPVWKAFVSILSSIQTDCLYILDVGGGIGSMATRIAKINDLPNIDYTIVDYSTDALHGAINTFEESEWDASKESEDIWIASKDNANMKVHLEQNDIFNFIRENSSKQYHVVIAESILDLIALEPFLDEVKPLLQDKNIFYTPENFNGTTSFLPSIDNNFDEKLVDLYHDSMYRDTPHGRNEGPKAGRKLLQKLRSHDAHIEAAASSDWIVIGRDGAYPGDEAYFLHHILHFVEDELSEHPDLDEDQFRDWMSTRRAQVESGELIYIAHQLDILARFE